MAVTKEKKLELLNDLKEKTAKQKIIIFANFKGLKAKELLELRKELKEKSSNFLVAKKTLMEIVFEEAGINFNYDSLEGEIALIFGFEDEITPAKTSFEFSKKYSNLKIIGGFLNGEFRAGDDIIALAKLPSREDMLARIVGSVQAPISGFANVLEGNIRGLIYALNAIGK